MNDLNDFAVLILTHGRPDKIYTIATLKKCGYTGPIYYLVDNEDSTASKYIENYGENVIIFDKKQMSDKTDEMDNFEDRRTITHARNASFEAAKKLKLKYFVQLDDDYTEFSFRTDSQGQYATSIIKKSLNNVFASMVRFLKTTPIKSIAFAQGGDFIGGKNGSLATKPILKRKCMNSFFCLTDRPIQFLGRLNEDVNTYTSGAIRGELFFTFPLISLNQKPTQSSSGGITEAYKEYGTYVKSFYTVMIAPSCTKISMLHTENKRVHHQINWANAAPVILNEKHQSKKNGK
jgi:hypothetical protein